MKFKGNYYTDYSGTEETLYFIANSENDVENYMEEGLYDYAEGWTHVAFGWNEEYTDAEFEDYLEDCGYTIEPISEENFDEFCEDEGIDISDFIDLIDPT